MKTILTLTVSLLLAGSFAHAGDLTAAVPKDYPLKTCPVSGELLGSDDMAPVKITYEKTDIWLCCKHCKKRFDKNPAKYVKIVTDAAKKKQK